MGELRNRMIHTLKIKGYSDKTKDNYVKHMEYFIKFHNISPDKLGPEDIYAYQVYLVNEKKVSWSTFNIAVCAMRFFYNQVLFKDWAVKHIPFQKKEKNYQLY